MTRAERFEDEKKRIIESCFSKVDGATGVCEFGLGHTPHSGDG
jgi:hypothetical protein